MSAYERLPVRLSLADRLILQCLVDLHRAGGPVAFEALWKGVGVVSREELQQALDKLKRACRVRREPAGYVPIDDATMVRGTVVWEPDGLRIVREGERE